MGGIYKLFKLYAPDPRGNQETQKYRKLKK